EPIAAHPHFRDGGTMRFTRRKLITGAGAAALSAAGLYELVDRYGTTPNRSSSSRLPPEQHLLDGLRVVHDEGVEIIVPPLHHQVVTAMVAVPSGPKQLGPARLALEQALAGLEHEYDPTPSGLGITVAWGLPYFRNYVPDAAETYLPLDRRASTAKGKSIQ